jgi:zinc D-Ala-D-Ala dipeptidase
MDFSMSHKKTSHSLIDVKSKIPDIEVDLKYASMENFTHEKIYNFEICYLLDVVVEKLGLIQQELATLNLGLKIWDGYRPIYAQKKLWQILPDENYVAHPQKGGRHTRGTAVDVTLINLSTKDELEMPSGFDDFSEKACINYMEASPNAIKNRTLLINIMQKHGFIVWINEWWHFDLCGWQDFPLIDKQIP